MAIVALTHAALRAQGNFILSASLLVSPSVRLPVAQAETGLDNVTGIGSGCDCYQQQDRLAMVKPLNNRKGSNERRQFRRPDQQAAAFGVSGVTS